MSPPSADSTAAFEAVARAVREMTPVGGGNTVPSSPCRVNLLARPRRQVCSVCKYPGHEAATKALSASSTQACCEAILSTIHFWEDMAGHISELYSSREAFHAAIINNEARYEMRLDGYPPRAGGYDEVFVERLTGNYLKFLSHWKGIRPKAVVMLGDEELALFENVTGKLNDFLLKGRTLSDLFEQSVNARE